MQIIKKDNAKYQYLINILNHKKCFYKEITKRNKKMKKLINQIIKFGIVGGICFFIDYGLMVLFTELFSIHYLISCGVAFSVSVIVNYLLSMKFVFESKNSSKIKEVIFFIILSVVGLILNQIVMWFTVDIINIHYMISKIGATVIVMIYNFVTRRLLLEKGMKKI